ncbi:hypothetical protein KSP39_PZI004864 [Platanthera zijinensis]|uniref:Retrotransposon gag domain-containing protein n=1 Tax=Platanthera zijinensis TaxID=2320716 RepID=A0AAP0BW65_9ASPA
MRALFRKLQPDSAGFSGGGSLADTRSFTAPATQVATRFSRLDFPRFFGEEVTEWIYKCEQFFDIDGTPPDMKVKMASVHMEGKAMYWHQAFMKARLTRQWPGWEEYCQAVAGRFGTLLFDDPMRDLKNLRQKGSVQAYLDEYDILLHRVDVSEEYAISLCLSGLKPEIEYAVRMFQPKTLQDVFSLARLQEHHLAVTQKRPTFSVGGQSYSNDRLAPPIKWQSPVKASSSPGLPTGSSSTAPPDRRSHHRLTSKEMDEKRSKGLCFWCDS